nr:immunoglobulin light chain junction region [Macaca mulatta]MOX18274.1 immunoglobulin light chain junction region [Macaca mulatta]MOX18538.1 immunoglobulin light chain junction region [Macaca mulatta]MOX19498.1 immunoglobulin light chain junction region [Macaca mulatta]MOX19563.1 immunoglobulin light chain junction region [Macaca mulatta]
DYYCQSYDSGNSLLF